LLVLHARLPDKLSGGDYVTNACCTNALLRKILFIFVSMQTSYAGKPEDLPPRCACQTDLLPSRSRAVQQCTVRDQMAQCFALHPCPLFAHRRQHAPTLLPAFPLEHPQHGECASSVATCQQCAGPSSAASLALQLSLLDPCRPGRTAEQERRERRAAAARLRRSGRRAPLAVLLRLTACYALAGLSRLDACGVRRRLRQRGTLRRRLLARRCM